MADKSNKKPKKKLGNQKLIKLETKSPRKKATLRYYDSKPNENVENVKETSDEHSKEFDGKLYKAKMFAKAFRRTKFLPLWKKTPEIDQNLMQKHSRGEKASETGVKTNFHKEKLKRKEIYYEYATEQAARTEILLNEDEGYIIPNDGEHTATYSQKYIAKNVDITSAAKQFELNLDFGPYKLRYTKNGRHLLLGGRKGHVAAFDWITKKLHFEINVMEEIADVSWLHIETMLACAQKNWVYFYDNKGTEIHCVKQLYKINQMEFLPYHFLLAAGSTEGYLSWLDVSIGEFVGNHNSKLGNIRIMRQNPVNGVLCIGGGQGVVSMWSPKVREPLAKILCHRSPMCSLAIDTKGKQMVTSGLDNMVKVWDIRNLEGPLHSYILPLPARDIELSQKGVMALSVGNVCEIYKSIVLEDNSGPYLKHRAKDFIHSMRFCPFEDVLGLTCAKGFTSILVPGSGEPNFDSFEANPFQTKSQRRENEIQTLLEKIPPEFIALDPNEIVGVDEETLKTKIDRRKQILYAKVPKVEFNSKRKMKGKKGSVRAAKAKQIVKDSIRKEYIQELKKSQNEVIEEFKDKSEDFIPLEQPYNVLDRFKPKKRKLNV